MAPLLPKEADRWFRSHTYPPYAGDIGKLLQAKRAQGLTLSVCLPALNEEATVGAICEVIREELMHEVELVDELIVMDSGSQDSTARVAKRHGANVYRADQLLPDIPSSPAGGKGEALWRSLAVVTGDIVVWLDSDSQNLTSMFVTSLVGPLIDDANLVFTKAFYRRPLTDAEPIDHGMEGARVTEVLARPLLQLFFPELSGFIQPLSGEYAIRKTAAMNLPFFTGYGVDVGLLIDAADHFGLNTMAQADLSIRSHRNRDIRSLGRTAHQVMQVILTRADEQGRVKLEAPIPTTLTQFNQGDEGTPTAESFDLDVIERPSIQSLLA